MGGRPGRGMTVGLREGAVRTDGPWSPPKIPLRKMAGPDLFLDTPCCANPQHGEIGRYSTFRGYNPLCFCCYGVMSSHTLVL